MPKRIIRLCYRKIIDNTAQAVWDKYVYDSSYTEFLLQAQFYNQGGKYNRLSELLTTAPASEKLHFLVSAAVVGYLQQLGEQIPDIRDNLGKQFLRFKNYRFEIIESDTTNKSNHCVAIHFFSEPLTWHETIGNYLLLSQIKEKPAADGVLTHLLQLQPQLSIYSLKEDML